MTWGRVHLESCRLPILPQAGAQSGAMGRLKCDGGSQMYRNAALKLWRAVLEVCSHAFSADAECRRVSRSFPAGPNPTSNLSHYPFGIPPSLAEAQPCAGLFLCLCAAGAAHQERFQSPVSTSDALKSVIEQYPHVREVCHCCVRANRHVHQWTDALNAKASARRRQYAAPR